MHHLRGWSMSPLHALQAEEVDRRLSGHCIFAMPNATQALEIQEGWRKQGKAAVQGTIPLQYMLLPSNVRGNQGPTSQEGL